MTDFARLVMTVDAAGMVPGEQALDQLARTGARVEGSLRLNTKGIEKSMASLGNVMGGLGGTMKLLEAALTRSMGAAAREAQNSARSFDDLRRSIDPAYAMSQRFADVQAELAAMVSAGTAKQTEANAVLEIARSRYLGVETAAEAAEQAQREQAAAVANATSNYQALRASLDPVYASSKRYEAAQEALTAAVKQGVISQTEMNRVVSMAERQYLAPVAPLKGVTVAAQAATDGSTRMGSAMVNAGFQVQDFAVQVASGQSAMMAFAQQFPQLMGVMGFSGTLAIAGAAIGTLAAVGMAVAPMFFDIGKGATSAQDAVDKVTDAFGAYQAAVDGATMSMVEAYAKFGENAQAARELYAITADLARIKFAQDYAASIGTITKPLNDLRGDLKLVDIAMRDAGAASADYENAVFALNQNFGMTVPQARALVAQMDALGKAKGVDAQSEAAGRLTRTVTEMLNSGVKLPPVFASIGQSAGDMAIQGLQFSSAMETSEREAAAVAATASGIPPIISDAAAEAIRLAQNLGLAMAQLTSVVAGIQTAQRTAQNIARINLETVGNPVERAGQIAEYKMLEESGTAAYAAIRSGSYGALTETKRLTEQVGEGARVTQTLEIQAAEADRAYAKLTANAAKAGKAGKKGANDAAKEAERLAKALDKSAEKWRDTLDPVNKYRREMAELAKLTGRLSKDEMAEAQRRLNVELADSLPLVGEFVDTMTEGLLNGFSGTLSDLGRMFKKWLADMIATAWKNRIVVGRGVSGGGMADAAGAAAGVPGMGGLGGAGGVLGGLGTGAAALGGAFLSGAGGFASAISAGGLGGAATYAQFMLGGATTSLAGFASALGAVALPLAAVVGVFSFFKKKTKELDAGLRVTVDGMDLLVETFRKTETRRFWGLSKKTRTSYGQADQETQDAISKAVGTLQDGILDAAKVLGFGAETFAAFSHVMQVSTKGMSEEEALAAVQEAIAGLGDDFAGMVPGLDRLRKDGEGASDALLRLSQSLVGVNGIMDTLGHEFRAAGLSGADAASKIAEAFGGLDAMASATQRFYEAMYSEEERLATTTRQTRKALADLGLAMPATRNEYRAMVAALDLTTKKGRETYAALIGMADAFDLILPQIGSLTAELAALQGAVQTGLEGAIEAAETAAQANARAAADWYKAAGSIRGYIDRLRSTASALFSPQQALRYNRGQYNATLLRAMAGDLTATQSIGGVADRYLASVLDTAKTREEAALAQARVLSDLGLLQGVADIEGARHDVIAGLLGQQVDLLKETRDFLANGGVLTEAMIEELSGKLGGLDEAIKAAELINYQYLKEKLAVTVDVIADADIPEHLKTLLANAVDGVEGFVDFIARSDLPADMKWLALAKSSEHAKTIKFLAEKEGLTPAFAALALKSGSRYQLNVTSALENGSALNLPQLRKLLAGTASGKLTLGGSFQFDPSKGFATWYETASKTAIANPMAALKGAMGTLQGALAKLQGAIEAEAKRAANEAARQKAHNQAVGRLSGVASKLASDGSGGYMATAAQVQAMAKAAGISTKGKTAQQLAREVAGFSTSDGIDQISVIGNLRNYLWQSFKKADGQVAVDAADYLRLYPDVANDPDVKSGKVSPQQHFERFGRNELLSGGRNFNPQAFDWSSIGLSIPGFASGGSHLGGLRIVGENGPELEATGPSRIFSNSQTRDLLGNREVVAELKALRAEMAELRAHARRTADSAVQTAKTLKRVDAVGVKIDPDQNKVTA
ncbi:hypothetical protein [Paracoccus benzoatiresistens]|uniref:Bacteriophage tail tape measure N-terminal domain-containing protein n=1 Tax=Paracoccus benzoatiresistens TaxID=2997341 RepID=A0ABT4JC25_9RHOB|nr:hypothetical protein [Paracoccus sp. EF6]MCZ0963893.1 hypothetical protein [Paracoccus sp. EF6]